MRKFSRTLYENRRNISSPYTHVNDTNVGWAIRIRICYRNFHPRQDEDEKSFATVEEM